MQNSLLKRDVIACLVSGGRFLNIYDKLDQLLVINSVLVVGVCGLYVFPQNSQHSTHRLILVLFFC